MNLPPKTQQYKAPRALILVFVLLIFGIGCVGYFYYKNEQKNIASEIEKELNIIADLKVQQIQSWYYERLADAEVTANNFLITENIGKLQSSGANEVIKAEITLYLEKVRRAYHYKSIFILNAMGNTVLSVPDSSRKHQECVRELFETLILDKQVIESGFHFNSDSSIHFLIGTPLIKFSGSDTLITGALLFEIDPHQFLYPLIQSWPTFSRTAEILLVYREGEEVVFLNELRHRKNTALTFRLPVSESQLPAVLALNGIEGNVAALDYRSIPVTASLRKISASPWFMVAKIDDEEMYAPLRTLFWQLVLLGCFMILAGALGMGMWWRNSKLQYFWVLYQKELERQALSRHFEYLTRYANDIILLMDENLKIIEANHKAEEVYGYSREQLTGMEVVSLESAGQASNNGFFWKKLQIKESVLQEGNHRRKDGDVFPVEISARRMRMENKQFYQAIIRDISERKAAEKIQSHLAAIVHSSEDAIISHSLDGKIISWNSGAQKLFGYTCEEITGQPLFLLFSQQNSGELNRMLMQIREGKSINHLETAGCCKNGNLIDVLVTVSPLRDSEGGLSGASTIIRDITELKKAQESVRKNEELLRKVLDTMPVGVWILNESGVIVNGNPAGQKIWEGARYVGMDQFAEYKAWWHKTGEPVSPENWAAARAIKKGETSLNEELEIECFDKSHKIILNSTIPMCEPDGKIIGCIVINQDITQLKHAENEIRKLNTELELRVQERTAELVYANKELEAFSYSVSHDLRAPLRHLSGFVDLLRENSWELFDESSRRYIAIISDSTNLMGRLIDELLLFSRMGRAEMTRSPVIAAEILNEALKILQPEIVERNIEWQIQPLPQVRADAMMLRQVFINLLSNALKFTRNREKAEIQVGIIPDAKNYIFFVKDNGVGFDMRYEDKLFGVFQRLHRADEYEGSGIGLANVRRIIHRHGGKTWAESILDQGATFYFSIPKNKQEI